jgi:SAM-dependent methyltransferase
MPIFYETHATDFSKSRFRIWPLIKKFLDDLPSNSTVLDIGCGNGKNMLYRSDLNIYGLEQSESLCDICKSRNLNVVQGSALQLPFANNTFDAIIMIAVIHHINPEEHNRVLKEIERVLKPSGRCLITNWAVEQIVNSKRSFHTGLNMVLWKGKEDLPLPYWIMDKSMAYEFTHNLPSDLECINLEWQGGNWYFTVKKCLQ